MMRQNTVFNNAESYTHSELVETVESVPEKAAFAVREGEYIVPTLLPKEYTEVEEIVSKIDELDLAIVEEVARSKYLNSLQIYELVSLRGFSVQREHLRKRILKLMRYRVIRENIIKSPDVERGIRYYELDAKGYVIAKDRGVIFHIGNYYMSYSTRVEQGKFDSPSDIKRILCGNQIVTHMLINNIKLDGFGIMETFCVENEDGLVTDGAILRTAANIKIDNDSVLAYEVVRDNTEGYIKLADKVERYYTLLHNKNYLIANHHGDTSFPQLVICGESTEHNKKIAEFLKDKGLWREENPILFTEDLLNIKDSAKSIYEIKGNELIWYCLPLKNQKKTEEKVSA